MRIVIFGLTLSSSWGNGHATIWRGLCAALARRGHHVNFFERDVSYYASHRDLGNPENYRLTLYSDWAQVAAQAREEVMNSDAAFVTSYCPDARAASLLIDDCNPPISVFYDLDTPVTLERWRTTGEVDYIPAHGLGSFDLVLSYTGGKVLEELRTCFGARRTEPLYGSVDPDVHRPVASNSQYSAHLSYLGTYASDRQAILEKLFVEPARIHPDKRFVIGGSQYPEDFPWNENIWFVSHVPPGMHPSFYCSSDLTLSVTRAAMAQSGYCPSGRLFEAAACETPVLTDYWEGLEEFFEPGKEILVASKTRDVSQAFELEAEELCRIGAAARERVLAQHTADHRSQQLLTILEAAA